MNAKPISFRVAAVCLSVLLGGTYLTYRSWAARGTTAGSPDANFLPGPKSAAVDTTLFPGTESPTPVTPSENVLFPSSKSMAPFTFPTQPQQQATPTK